MKKGTIYFLTVPFDKQSFALQHITYYDTLLYDYIGNNNGSIFFILLFKFVNALLGCHDLALSC